MTWQNVLRCASGSKARLKKIQIFFRMCLSIKPCQQQELCVLGISSTRWSPSEITALCKVHCMGCHFETWHNQIVLVWEWCWRDNDDQWRSLHRGSRQVLEDTRIWINRISIFLKDHVYQNNPKTIAEVKVAITQQIHGITKEECVKVTKTLLGGCFF